MKAYFIDPVQKAISEVDYNGDYRTIKNHIRCDLFDVVRLVDSDVVFVDDEGLINGGAERYGWFLLTQTDAKEGEAPRRIPLAGYGLVLGTGSEGESIAVGMTLAQLRAMVSFPTYDEIMALAQQNKLG